MSYPAWVQSFRPHQTHCTEEILDAFNSGIQTVFLDGPTGSGKTLIGEMVRQGLKSSAVYCCHDKTLQDQFVRDFDYARVLKGRRNYETLFGGPDVTAEDCTLEAKFCVTGCHDQSDRCPYRKAKLDAALSDLAVLNTSYLLAETSSDQTQFGKAQFPLLILDECDTVEKVLMSAVEVYISSRRLEELKCGQPAYVTKPEYWRKWVVEAVIPAVRERLARFSKSTTNIYQLRRRKSWERLLGSLNNLIRDDLDLWTFDRRERTGGISLKPIRVDQFGPSRIWNHFPRRLLMSATIVSPDELVESLGIPGEYHVVRAPMTFPVDNRRIHVAPVANMTNKAKESEWPKMAEAVGAILANHPRSQRVLVHTVSYGLAEYLKEHVGTRRPVFTYRSAADRDGALSDYRSRVGSVLFAPSLERGVDFKDTDCRVTVIAKVPFLNLGDKQISARLHSRGGNLWYRVQTIRSLVQSTGRGVRSDTDWCTSYILDGQFTSNLWKESKHLFPQWWKDALDFSFNIKQLKGNK